MNRLIRVSFKLLDLLVIFMMVFGSPMSAAAQVWTDQPDYTPGSIVTINGDNSNGAGYLPSESVDVTVSGPNGYAATCQGVADDLGAWSCYVQLWAGPEAYGTYTYTSLGQLSGVRETGTFSDAPPDLEQLWQCDPPTGYDPNTYACVTDGAVGWVFGNDDGPFAEGETIPYRTRMKNLVTNNQYSITIQWDTTKSSKHAIDYIKTWNATIEAADPCLSLTGLPAGLCSTSSTYPIPADTFMQSNADWIANTGVQDSGVFTMYGGTITGVSAYTNPSNYTGDTSTSITISFTASSTDAVLAWGGHIAERDDWGIGNSAAFISGSPYHMRILTWYDISNKKTLNVGNVDRSLSAEAVIYPASITIIKDATPDGPTTFNFTASPSPLYDFPLVDDGTTANTIVFGKIMNFTTYTVSETEPDGWDLTNIACTVLDANGGTQTVSLPSVTINLKEAELVTCTFANTLTFVPMPEITVTKTGTPLEVPETGGDVVFTYIVENTGNVPVWITSLSDDPFGTLTGDNDCMVGTELAVDGSCSFDATFNIPAGAPGTTHIDTFTAHAEDADATDVWDEDDETITYADVLPEITVTKTGAPTTVPETGGNVTFTYTVENTGDVTVWITSLSDDQFGTLTGDVDCMVGTELAAGASCSFDATFTIQAGVAGSTHVNVFTAHANDADDNDTSDTEDETITRTDVLPLISVTKIASPLTMAEPGGEFTFTYVVTNDGLVPVTVISVSDSVIGTITLPADVYLLPGESTTAMTSTLTYTDAGTYPNTVTAIGEDDEGNTNTATASAEVTVTDVMPVVDLVKDVTPATLAEPGGAFHYTLTITNNSVENVTITTLTDDNPLPAACTDLIDDVLTPGQSVSCTYDVTHTEAGSYPNTASVTVNDNEGNSASDSDSETVSVTDELPAVDLVKDVTPATLAEPGGVFTYTLTITNNSVETVTITALTDDNALSAQCLALVGTTLAAGASTSCTYTVTHPEAGSYPNTASVTVEDNEGNSGSDSDSETVSVTDILPTVDLTKSADPLSLPEPGGEFTFTLSIHNTSPEAVTITALTDDNALSAECLALINTVIPTGGTVSCQYTVTHTEAGSYPNTAEVTVEDNEGTPVSDSDDETVTVTDVLPTITVDKSADPTSLPEPGGMVTFTVVVTNNSFEPVTLTSLTDDVYDDLNGQGSCATGGTIAAGASYTCEFEGAVSGEPGFYTDTVTAVATDNDGSTDSDDDNATVELTDEMPAVTLDKSASPLTLPEPGGVFTFTLTITNDSVETVEITALSDDNALSAECLALIGTFLDPGESASCTYTVTHTEAGSYLNTAEVTVEDNEGNPASDDDNETVTVTDVKPTIMVEKTASPTSVNEPGGNVLFTFKVTNTSVEAVSISELSDSIYGTLPGDADCQVGTVLTVGAYCEFSFTEFVAGDASDPDHVNVFTGKATDNDGNTATDTDDATVGFDDVKPTITLTKTAGPATLPEPGGAFTYTYTIHNGSIEAVKLTKVTDDVLGALYEWKAGDPEIWIAAGANYLLTGTFTKNYTDAGSYTNIAWAYAIDNENNEAKDDDTKTVSITDVLPVIEVTKVPSVSWVSFPGGSVTFSGMVSNKSVEPVTLTSLVDNVFGDLADPNNPLISNSTVTDLPKTLAVSGTYFYSFTATVTGNVSTDPKDTITATAKDNEDNKATATASATVHVYTRLLVEKTVNQKPFSGPELTFELRQGAAPISGQFGQTLETEKANSANGGLVDFTTNLDTGTYQLCEYVPEGYVPSYIWGVYGVDWFKPGYGPNEGSMLPYVLICSNIVVNADGTINFQNGHQIVQPGDRLLIDNQVGQMPRTIGYWKNHAYSKESSGGQDPVLDQMLCKATQLNSTITIGLLALPGCNPSADNAGTSSTNAVRLLNKSTINTNKKMASDPLFNLAAQLLAYRLNQRFGAWPNDYAQLAADYAQQMLVELKFDGTATHTKPSAKAIANLNYLAWVLDAFNNDTLTLTPPLAVPYPGVYK